MNWLTEWSATNVIGFVFKDIFLELAKDGGRDYVKGFFKDGFDNLALADKAILQIGAGQALKEFLVLVQQQLESTDLDEIELRHYLQPFRSFIYEDTVRETLAIPFHNDERILESKILARTWNDLNLLPLPEDFHWEVVVKLYRRKVKYILQDSDRLPAILAAGNSAPTTNETSSNIAADKNNLELQGYRQALQEKYGNLRLDSLDTSGAAYDELKLWRIFVPQNVREIQEFIARVYELPKEQQLTLQQSSQFKKELSSKFKKYREIYYQQPLRSVLDVIAAREYPYLVILGDPGSGKTTLLQYMALQWTELPFSQWHSHAIPLFIELRTYIRELDCGRCRDLMEFFAADRTIINLPARILQERLKSGNATVMFDGLDEVFNPTKREEAIAAIIGFARAYPRARIAVTSRVIGYQQKRLREAGFVHFILQDLEPGQVEDFIDRWHDLTFYDPVDKERKRERLKKAIKESASIRELSGNPFAVNNDGNSQSQSRITQG